MKKLLSSRLVILAVVFVGLYAILGMRLFNLQIMEGEQYQENYMAKTEKKISLAGTRGNIYDRNGNLLAYNKLSYNVTRSEEHTSELQSLPPISYAVFCLKKIFF